MIKEKLISTIRDKKKERERVRQEKEKIKRRSRKYGHSEEKHSKRGMLSCILAACAVFLSVLVFSVSYISRGEVSLLIGFVGLIILALSATGLFRAIQGFKERNRNYLTCRIGIVCNGILLLGLIGIFLRGLF